MDDRIKRTIDRLKALDLVGKDSNERLSAICTVLYQPEYGWTRDACEKLRQILIDWLEQFDPADWADGYLAEQGLVRQPKNANGEVIHVGDDVANADGEHDTVVSFMLHSDGTWSTRAFSMWLPPDALSHYHAPTAEDVLREFLSAAEDAMRKGFDEVPSETFTEYAKKLREVMVDE